MAIIAAVAYAGSQYVPVAYQAYLFKDFMADRVTYAAATGKTTGWIENQLRSVTSEYGVPPTAIINAQQQDSRVEARVRFVRPVQLPGYTYQYAFDHTAKSSHLLSVK